MDKIYTVLAEILNNRVIQTADGSANRYITAVPDYVSFKATPEQKESTAGTGHYRVRKAWEDAKTQMRRRLRPL